MTSRIPETSSYEDLLACSHDCWYPYFKKYAIKSRSISLSDDFIEYLFTDGVLLPKMICSSVYDPRYESNTVESVDSDDEDISEEEVEPPVFEDLEIMINDSINELNGCCFPKSNWNSPKDCLWMTGNLKCETPGDVFMFLKSSGILQSDYQKIHSYKQESNGISKSLCPQLILLQWATMFPSMQFRLFIYHYYLIAITQKDSATYYSFLKSSKDHLQSILMKFVETIVVDRFSLENFVLDVYVDKQDNIYILDFSPFSKEMNPLLISMEQLEEKCEEINQREQNKPKNLTIEMKNTNVNISGEESNDIEIIEEPKNTNVNISGEESNDIEIIEEPVEPLYVVLEENPGTQIAEQMFYQYPYELQDPSLQNNLNEYLQSLQEQENNI
ncbi:hypothetical protein WA158_001800 [Blastocystis sp. Blastoise]